MALEVVITPYNDKIQRENDGPWYYCEGQKFRGKVPGTLCLGLCSKSIKSKVDGLLLPCNKGENCDNKPRPIYD